MGALELTKLEPNHLNHSSGLLVSILLRYPEVGTISCFQDQYTLVLKFLIKKEMPFDGFYNKVHAALALFHKLEGLKPKVCKIQKIEDELDSLVITRDLSSLSLQEINLIIEMIKTNLEEHIITEESSLPDEELQIQEEIISHMLSAIHSHGTAKNTIAVREDGRVLVFHGKN